MNNIFDLSVQPNLSCGVNLMRFKGCYRLVGFMAKLDRKQKPYWVIQLSDVHSSVTGYLFTALNNIKDLHHGAMVQCEMSVRRHNQKKYLHVAYIEKASDELSVEKSGLSSLPCALTPAYDALPKLCSVVSGIESDSLRRFIAEVLVPSNICLPFIQAPASLNHHHNYPGGLVLHSLEVAQIVENMPWNDSWSRDLAIVAALLHDIGKVKTMSVQMKRTAVGHWVDHDALTLEICSRALISLEGQDEKSATLLRHIWTCASPGARYGYRAATPIANAVQSADRLSAEMDKLSQQKLNYR